jgi:glucokinase
MIGLSVEHPETEAAIRRVTGGRAERITAEQVFRLAAEGDVVAKGVTQEVCTCLGIALANIIHIINPGMIILGGQVAQAGDLLIEPLKEHLYDLCLEAAIEGLTASGNDATQQGRLLRVVQGALGSDANSVGAITLALQDI